MGKSEKLQHAANIAKEVLEEIVHLPSIEKLQDAIGILEKMSNDYK